MTFKIGEPVSEDNPLPVQIVEGQTSGKIGEPISPTNPRSIAAVRIIGAGGASITLDPSTVAADATGVVAQLRTGLTGALTWSKLSGAAKLTIAATGAVSLSVAIGAGVSEVFRVRVQNADGYALEAPMTLTGAAAATIPDTGGNPQPTTPAKFGSTTVFFGDSTANAFGKDS